MAACRLLALLACLSGSAGAQPAPTPMPPPLPPVRPVIITPPIQPMPPLTMPSTNPTRRILPMPGRPGRFIVCPGHRLCPRSH